MKSLYAGNLRFPRVHRKNTKISHSDGGFFGRDVFLSDTERENILILQSL